MSALGPESRTPKLPLDRELSLIAPQMIDPADLEAEPLRKGLALWRELAGERPFPSRAQFSPRVLGRLLRHTALVKVLEDGEFQLRVVGDTIQAVQPVQLQGLTTAEIDAVIPDYGTLLRAIFRQVCDTRLPLAFRGAFRRLEGAVGRAREQLILPLGARDDAVDHLISLVVYLTPE